MTDKELIQTYRKIKEMGFSKLEAKQIYKQNTTCIEGYLGVYSNLNEALDKIEPQGLDKKTLMKKINEGTYKARIKSEIEYKRKNLTYGLDDFSII